VILEGKVGKAPGEMKDDEAGGMAAGELAEGELGDAEFGEFWEVEEVCEFGEIWDVDEEDNRLVGNLETRLGSILSTA
jgi:hypothetical protein